jgi:hypothetical protein
MKGEWREIMLALGLLIVLSIIGTLLSMGLISILFYLFSMGT